MIIILMLVLIIGIVMTVYAGHKEIRSVAVIGVSICVICTTALLFFSLRISSSFEKDKVIITKEINEVEFSKFAKIQILKSKQDFWHVNVKYKYEFMGYTDDNAVGEAKH